ncbi:SMI1/KNR4 family protein [Chitinibacter sp. SCUT-21]
MAFDLNEEFIQAAEQALGATLPASYRQAMQQHNGGCVLAQGDSWQQHPIADTSDRKRLARSCNHILKETAFYQDCGFFPPMRSPLPAMVVAINWCLSAPHMPLTPRSIFGRMNQAS